MMTDNDSDIVAFKKEVGVRFHGPAVLVARILTAKRVPHDLGEAAVAYNASKDQLAHVAKTYGLQVKHYHVTNNRGANENT